MEYLDNCWIDNPVFFQGMYHKTMAAVNAALNAARNHFRIGLLAVSALRAHNK
jgi:hypothetical protein